MTFDEYIRINHAKSHAQIAQDLWVLFMTGEKRNGYFVEFGAGDGKTESNTYLLEKEYGWTGVVAEPARCFHEALARNRSCWRWNDAVTPVPGVFTFSEYPIRHLSCIDDYRGHDRLAQHRECAEQSYQVNGITLEQLLDAAQAPSEIDYLSIDTEGSELEILLGFDLDKYQTRLISIEHNGVQPKRELIRRHLTARGYARVFEEFSQFDDWYVRGGLHEC